MASHSKRVLLAGIFAALPATVFALLFVWLGDFTPKVQWSVTVLVVGALFIGILVLQERVVLPLQTVSNLLAALREGDYSLRARGATAEDPLGLVYLEANALRDTLRSQRLGALEATALLRTVVAEVDVAVLSFDEEGKLGLVNRAGERLLGQPAERVLGRDAASLGLAECLEGDTPRVVERGSAPAVRWELRRTSFRQGGTPHQLLVLADVSRTLQSEERQAWQRLVRVLSHEINNSLAPIRSLAGSLRTVISRPSSPPEAQTELLQGLDIIAQRSEALARFMGAYARLARLPRPVLAPIELKPWVHRVVGLVQDPRVQIGKGPGWTLAADADQLDQLLINLLRNALEAMGSGKGRVTIHWERAGTGLELMIDDEGPGVAETANLFVPFYTTKPGGSGIGLVLSRQIAEGHGGSLRLENRGDRTGCRARLWLPLGPPRPPTGTTPAPLP
jgi:PAS domain S-box-containing protein